MKILPSLNRVIHLCGWGLGGLMIVFCLSLLVVLPSAHAQADDVPLSKTLTPRSESPETTVTGVVLKITEKQLPAGAEHAGLLATGEQVQLVQVRITSGELKGKQVQVENVQGQNPIYNIPLEEGARVLLFVEKTPDGRHQVYISNRDRMPALMLLGGVFLLALLVIGGKPTFKYAALSGFGLLLILRSVIPPILAGEPGSLMAVVLTLLVALAGGILLLEDRFQTVKNMMVLILASVLNIVMLLLLMFLAAVLAPLQGYFSESMASLWYQYPELDFQQMLFATAAVSHLGLLFFISLNLLQAILRDESRAEERTPMETYRIALHRGQQVLGPMIFAASMLYLGMYFPNLLQGAGSTILDTLNLEAYATYAAIMLAGALALVLSVPVSAGLYAWLLTPRRVGQAL